jgi:hypothetical protein
MASDYVLCNGFEGGMACAGSQWMFGLNPPVFKVYHRNELPSWVAKPKYGEYVLGGDKHTSQKGNHRTAFYMNNASTLDNSLGSLDSSYCAECDYAWKPGAIYDIGSMIGTVAMANLFGVPWVGLHIPHTSNSEIQIKAVHGSERKGEAVSRPTGINIKKDGKWRRIRLDVFINSHARPHIWEGRLTHDKQQTGWIELFRRDLPFSRHLAPHCYFSSEGYSDGPPIFFDNVRCGVTSKKGDILKNTMSGFSAAPVEQVVADSGWNPSEPADIAAILNAYGNSNSVSTVADDKIKMQLQMKGVKFDKMSGSMAFKSHRVKGRITAKSTKDASVGYVSGDATEKLSSSYMQGGNDNVWDLTYEPTWGEKK